MYTWRRDVRELQLAHDWFTGTYYFLYRGVWILADGGPVNWDRDGVGSETDVSADINGDGSNSRLTSPDDIHNFVIQIKVEPTGVSWLNGNEASEETVAPTDELCDGADNDYDGMIDEGFPDTDQDGVADFIDNALNAYNPLQVDIDRNYIGDYAEVPLNKATTMSGSFDKGKLVTYLAWQAPNPAPALLGFNVYRRDKSGVFKRLGKSWPTTLENKYTDAGPFLLDVSDSLMYYVRPVSNYMIEGIQSGCIILKPGVQTVENFNGTVFDNSFTCYPNPFSSSVTLSFTLKAGVPVSVAVYNLLGEKVKILADSWPSTDINTFTWDGISDNGLPLPPGTYICRVVARDFTRVVKIVMNK
jgi:hypothetical protein